MNVGGALLLASAVMDGLDESLASMLLSDFRYIRSLNAFGCNKLECNVSTLEQILSLITTDKAVALEASRQFYRLASFGPDVLSGDAMQVSD